MKNSFKIILMIICVWFTVVVNHAQTIRVIDHKGTSKSVDNSKWQLSGVNIFNKYGGNVGIGTNDPTAKFHTVGSIRLASLGTNTTNTDIMTTDVTGNVTTRTIFNLLDGNAVTSLNGLTNSVQLFSIGALGVDVGISSVGNTHTFNIPTASASSRGALSSGDWTSFNNKESAITSGTTAQYFRGDKTWQSLQTTIVSEGTNLYFTNARSRSAISLTTVGASGVASYNSTTGVLNIPNYADGGIISFNGLNSLSQNLSVGTAGVDVGISSVGNTHTFNIPTASASSRGALSSGDWTSFNNKISVVAASTPAAITTTGTNINVNNTGAHWNANQLTGRNISNVAPTEGQVLTWDATLNTWRPAAFGVFPVVTITNTSYTLSVADHGKILDFTSNAAISISVPSTLTAGFQVSITQAGTGQITFSGSGGMSVNNRWGGTTTSGRWAKAGLEVRATNSSVLSGDVQ